MANTTGRYNANVSLPRRYKWMEGDTPMQYNTIGELLRAIRKHRVRHGGDLSIHWQARVGNQICEDVSSRACSEQEPKVRSLGLADVGVFLTTMKAWVRSGGAMVDQEEADARSSICGACPNNMPVRGCGACKRVIPRMFPKISKKAVVGSEKLQGCGVCGCDLKLKIWIDAEVLAPGTKDPSLYPEECWIRQALEEH